MYINYQLPVIFSIFSLILLFKIFIRNYESWCEWYDTLYPSLEYQFFKINDRNKQHEIVNKYTHHGIIIIFFQFFYNQQYYKFGFCECYEQYRRIRLCKLWLQFHRKYHILSDYLCEEGLHQSHSGEGKVLKKN